MNSASGLKTEETLDLMPSRRSLALPHRALRASSVNRFHILVSIVAALFIEGCVLVFHSVIWDWQIATWSELLVRFGIVTSASGQVFGWEQQFLLTNWSEVLISSTALILVTWLVLRSAVIPMIKGLFVVITVPLFLYSLVVFLRGVAPAGVLDHIGPEWLYGEIVLWCLIPVVYALFVFPLPFSLIIKLASLVAVLIMSVAWRTATPVIYILIAVHTQGLFAIPAWMALGPWADFIYIIPVFSMTLTLYKGGRPDDYRT